MFTSPPTEVTLIKALKEIKRLRTGKFLSVEPLLWIITRAISGGLFLHMLVTFSLIATTRCNVIYYLFFCTNDVELQRKIQIRDQNIIWQLH